MHKLLSYNNCENIKSARRILDGIVIDATAISILGKLPKFRRHTWEIEPVKNATERQCIMGNARNSQFVDIILYSILGNQNCMAF